MFFASDSSTQLLVSSNVMRMRMRMLVVCAVCSELLHAADSGRRAAHAPQPHRAPRPLPRQHPPHQRPRRRTHYACSRTCTSHAASEYCTHSGPHTSAFPTFALTHSHYSHTLTLALALRARCRCCILVLLLLNIPDLPISPSLNRSLVENRRLRARHSTQG